MNESTKSAEAVALKQQNPTWGYIKIANEIGLHKDKVRRAIEKAGLNDTLVRAGRAVAVIEIEPRTAAEFAERISACWRRSTSAIIETGHLILRAKAALPHGVFLAMVEAELPFGPRQAQRLMAIALDPKLVNATNESYLPPNVSALYELTKVNEETFTARIADGTIRPDMERSDISAEVKRAKRTIRERILGGIQCALPTQKFGVIVADPEWRFEPWSRTTGMDRAADNHYPTSVTEVIAARDVPSIAADDCVLFLWATVPILPNALLVMGAWGFDYKSHIIWEKDKIGTGYWFRNKHELLLVGTRGNVPAPAMGEQWPSVIGAQVQAHSAKPEQFLEMIEEYFPTLPKIELNRRGLPRPGWIAWGNQAQATEAAE